jgi:hypothetical protein
MTETTWLTLQVGGEGADPQELDELTAGLRQELLDLDVDAVDLMRTDGSLPRAKGAGHAALGALVVTLATPGLLASVVAAVRAWLDGRGQGAVKIEVDGDVLEITGLSSGQQQQLIDGWLRRRGQQ